MRCRGIDAGAIRVALELAEDQSTSSGIDRQNGASIESSADPSAQVPCGRSRCHCSTRTWVTHGRSISIIRGSRPGPTVTIIGGMPRR